MRVLLDTNVLARAFCDPSGPAAALFFILGGTSHQLITSRPLLAELSRVLRYDRLRIRHGRVDADIDLFLELVASLAVIVEPQRLKVVASDPDDDFVLGTAVAGLVDVLCTLDRHLSSPTARAFLGHFGVRVATDADVLDDLRPPQAGSGN